MTDIHLQPEQNAVEGLKMALDTINKINPDFVITGGDQIMDALNVSFGRADSLYSLYQEVIKSCNSPVYNTMGNHEIFAMYSKNDSVRNHPEYGEKMFENRIGESYYSFEHKGWKFMILNSVEEKANHRYEGYIDSDQLNWIKTELEKTEKEMPIVLSTHIPLISAYKQILNGSTVANDSSWVIYNSKEVLELFGQHNLKLVLQGHLHIVEDIHINNTHFITGGAISANWWNGSYHGFEEGFLKINVIKDDFNWEFIDYKYSPPAE